MKTWCECDCDQQSIFEEFYPYGEIEWPDALENYYDEEM